jgi:hypothetical protein
MSNKQSDSSKKTGSEKTGTGSDSTTGRPPAGTYYTDVVLQVQQGGQVVHEERDRF